MFQYSIRPGVYFAAVQGEGVVMDLVRDRYYGLNAESADIWDALLQQHDASQESVTPSPALRRLDISPDMVAAAVAEWERAGLVTRAPEEVEDKLPTLKLRRGPAEQGLDEARIADMRLSWPMVLYLIGSMVWCRHALRRDGLGWTLRAVQTIPAEADASSPAAAKRLYRMLRAYYSLRRIHMQGRDDCLTRSLALAAALRRKGLDAAVCFGVRKFPFFAHAWVEVGRRVVNERFQKVRLYTLLARF